jgi:hypothetical protein
MELMQIVSGLLVAIIVLAILLFLFPKEMTASVKETITERSTGAIQLLKKPIVTIQEPIITYDANNNPVYSYLIKVTNLDMIYTKKLSEPITVIPVIEFKDKSAVGDVDNSIIECNGGHRCILLPTSEPKFGGTVEANIVSRIPPIAKFEGSLIGGQKVYLETTETPGPPGKYAVTAADFYIKIADRITDPLSPTCWVLFFVENEKDSRQISLTSCSKGKCGGSVSFGLGEVAFRNVKIENCKKVTAEITAKNGEPWDVEERVILSFWESTPCTANLETYESLKEKCLNAFTNNLLFRKSLSTGIESF